MHSVTEGNAVLVSEANDGVVVVELNRPSRLNAVDLRLRRQLADTFDSLARDETAHAVVLAGRGPSFCAGGDVGELSRERTLDEDRGRILEGNRMIRSLYSLRLPVVAAVHGSVAGAGIALCIASDVVVASEGTRFHFAFLKLGLGPDAGSSYLLSQRVGSARARSLFLRAASLEAGEALELGIVDMLAPAEEGSSTAVELARELASRSSPAISATKELCMDVAALDEAMSRELEFQVALLRSAEHIEARERFLSRSTKSEEVEAE